MNKKDTNQRIPFLASASQIEDMELMVEICEFGSKRELIANALGFLRWAIDTVGKGGEIAVLSKGGKEAQLVHVVALQNAKRNLTVEKTETPERETRNTATSILQGA